MALVKYYKAGNATPLNTFSIAGDGLYTAYYSSGSYSKNFDFIQIKGTNVSDLVRGTANYTNVKLLTFANGNYLAIRVNEPANFGNIERYHCSARVFDKNDKAIFSGQDFYVVTAIGGDTSKAYSTLFLGVDDELKYAYCTMVTNGLNNDVAFYQFSYGYPQSGQPQAFYNIVKDSGIEYDPDPWAGAGYAGIGGGGGTFDFKSDTINLPDLPAVNAVSTGFLQLFAGDISKIVELSSYMWSNNFFDSIVKITSNPIDIIMGLYMYPFPVPVSGAKYVRAGNVITNITMNIPSNQVIEIDCGELEVPSFYGAYLDFEPFSKCEIFLPYCGTFPLSMDDISGKVLKVKYRVDLLTGVCACYVIIDDTVKYNFTGTCAINIPISSRSFENLYNSIVSMVASSFGSGTFGLPSIGSVAGTVTSGKNQIKHGGNCSGNSGFMGVQKPFLIFNLPNIAIPQNLNTYTGYPVYATYKLSDLKGYSEIEEIHLENMGTATQAEIDSLVSLLKGGVIF